MPVSLDEKVGKYFTPEYQNLIIKNYFKGMTIDQLAYLYESSEDLIQQIIIANGIDIVDNKLPIKQKRKRNK